MLYRSTNSKPRRVVSPGVYVLMYTYDRSQLLKGQNKHISWFSFSFWCACKITLACYFTNTFAVAQDFTPWSNLKICLFYTHVNQDSECSMELLALRYIFMYDYVDCPKHTYEFNLLITSLVHDKAHVEYVSIGISFLSTSNHLSLQLLRPIVKHVS